MIINKNIIDFINKNKLFLKILLISTFICILIIFLYNFYYSLNSGKLGDKISISMKCDSQDILESIYFYKVTPKNEITILKLENQIWSSDESGYFKNIWIVSNKANFNQINELQIKIGKKDFIFNKNDIKNFIITTNKEINYKYNDVDIYQIPDNVRTNNLSYLTFISKVFLRIIKDYLWLAM